MYEFKEFGINLWTLSFKDKKVEKEFLEEYPHKYLIPVRVAIIIGVFVYNIFLILDKLIAPEQAIELWFIRLCIFTPYMILFFILTFTKFYYKYMQILIAFCFIICNLSVAYILYIVDPEIRYMYYPGFIISCIFNYGVIKTRFIWAIPINWSSIIIYEWLCIITNTPMIYILNNTFFLLSCHFAGMVLCYNMEYYSRRDFIHVRNMKELDQKKDMFIAIAAHELKTPLTSIQGFLELLKIEDNKQKIKKYISLTLKNTDRLYNLILDLVDSTRLSLGKMEVYNKKMHTYDVIKEIEDNYRHVVESEGLIFNVCNVKNIYINADYVRVLQILRNFISNSIHFTRNGTITLSIRENKDDVYFSVKDTGCGIANDMLENIFDKFYQISGNNKKVLGSGLGLSICKGLSRLMDGEIIVNSEIGKWTCFEIKFKLLKV